MPIFRMPPNPLGPVESKLNTAIAERGCVHLALLDPERPIRNLPSTLRNLESLGTAAVMVGGSTVDSSGQLEEMLAQVRSNVHIPSILFPNNEGGISRNADAIFFMSLLNSSEPRYLMGAQAKGAPLVRDSGIEPIPMGYLVVGTSQTAVSKIGRVFQIPYSRPEVAAEFALAAQYLGMRFVYLEAGSGAEEPVDPAMIRRVVATVEIPVIVGGGIRNARQTEKIVQAGASAIVTGTVLEDEGLAPVRDIVDSMKRVLPNAR